MSDADDEPAVGEYNESGDEERGEEEEEEDDAVEDKPLTLEMIGECLSLLCKTADGLEHAFSKFDAKEKELTNIDFIATFIHLRYIDISSNNLTSISALKELPQILVLNAENNRLTSIDLPPLLYLQVASFKNNRLTTTSGLNHPKLEVLNISFNEIEEVKDLDPSCLMSLHTIELRKNKLVTTDGISMPNLRMLYLAENNLTSIVGLDRLRNLTTLHLRDNLITSLDGFSVTMKSLQYINFRNNNLSIMKELQKLQVLPMLRSISLGGNPVASEDDYRLEVLITLRRLERLDKEEFGEDERMEAEDVYEQRRLEQLAAEDDPEELIASDDEA